VPKTQSELQQEEATARRRDEALRRALNTPPKQHKDMKKGKGKKRQDDHPTASGDKRD
jgi:hypothetical protein